VRIFPDFALVAGCHAQLGDLENTYIVIDFDDSLGEYKDAHYS